MSKLLNSEPLRRSSRSCRARRPMSPMRRSAIAALSAAASLMPILPPNCRPARSRSTPPSSSPAPEGEREIKAEDFFIGLMETALRPGELIVAVRFPVRAPATRFAFGEFARRRGDFAVAGVAICAETERGRIADVSRRLFWLRRSRQRSPLQYRQPLTGLPLAQDQCGRISSMPSTTISIRTTFPAGAPIPDFDLAKEITRRAIGDLQQAPIAPCILTCLLI